MHLLLFLIHSHTGMCGWSNDLCRLSEKGGPQDPRLPESLPDLRRWLGGCADPREASPAHRHFHLHTMSCHLSTRMSSPLHWCQPVPSSDGYRQHLRCLWVIMMSTPYPVKRYGFECTALSKGWGGFRGFHLASPIMITLNPWAKDPARAWHLL